MIPINYEYLKQNFEDVYDTVASGLETIIITREHGENVVLISESEYNNIFRN